MGRQEAYILVLVLGRRLRYCVLWTCYFTSLSLSFCIIEIGLGEHRLAARLPWDWTLALARTSYGNLGSLLPSLSPHFLVCKMGTPCPTSQGCWEDERR